MTPYAPPGEHDVLLFLTQVVVLLVAARGLGLLALRIGLPGVVGELAAGLIVGPSVFGRLAPGAFDWLFPGDEVVSGMLFTVGWIGVLLLLVVTGFETDLGLVRRHRRAAGLVAGGSLLVPFAVGLVTGFVAPDLLLADPDRRVIFALFLATALSISSLPVIAKILTEMRLMRRDFAQVTLAASMVNDVVGWVLLGLIAGLAQSGELELGRLAITIGGLAAFLGLAPVVGQWVVDRALRGLRRAEAGIAGWLTVAIAFALGCAAITQALGVEAVLGAFVAGILLHRSRFVRPDLEGHLETMSSSFFAPIFFATAGLQVDLALLGELDVVVWGVVIVVVASIGKFGGAFLGARWAALSRREGLALGAGLNARGALEIVIAAVGLGLGVLNPTSYTLIVLMAIATSIMAAPALRLIVRGWSGSLEEQRRLLHEEILSRNVFLRSGRVLVPSRGAPGSTFAASLLGACLPREAPVTVLTVHRRGEPVPDLTPVIDALAGLDVEVAQVEGEDVADSIMRHASLGYETVVLGIEEYPRRSPHAGPLSALVNQLLVQHPSSTLLVRADSAADEITVRRILLPMSTGRASRAALEVALGVSAGSGAELVVMRAETDDGPGGRGWWRFGRSSPGESRPLGERVLAHATATAAEVGVPASSLVRSGKSRGATILEAADSEDADLVVVGATVRRLEDAPFLGETVEHVLRESTTAVVVVVTPAGD